MTSEDYYLKGNEFRRRGDFRQAMEMLDNIFAFYCKDLYNP